MISNIRIPSLHKDEKLFRELINLASAHFSIAAEQVEKDYWITRMLKQLEQSRFKDNVYFKGGTCLFKAYGIIKRFSEDLDLYIDTNNPSAGGDPERKLNGEVYHFLIDHNEDIHCDNPDDPDVERGLYNKANFLVNESTIGTGLKKYLQVETTISSIKRRTSIYQPYEQKDIISIIGKYLAEKAELCLIGKYELDNFSVNCIRPEKTLCDKISRLIRLSFEEEPNKAIAGSARDLYDIFCLMNDTKTATEVTKKSFEEGLLLTIEQDRLQHKYSYTDKDFKEAIIFKDTEAILTDSKVEAAYRELANLLIDKEHNLLPELSKVISSLKSLNPIILRAQLSM